MEQDSEMVKRLGAAMKEARQRLGLSQADVAHDVGLAAEVYGRYERGDGTPSVGALVRICLRLNVSVDGALLGAKLPEGPLGPSISSTRMAPSVRKLVRVVEWLPEYKVRALLQMAKLLSGRKPDGRKLNPVERGEGG